MMKNKVKKIFRRIAIVLIALIPLWFILIGPSTYFCYKCGAYKMLTVEQRPISKLVEETLGRSCSHQWITNTIGSNFIHVDYEASRRIPLLMGNIQPVFEALPDGTLKKNILESLIDSENLLSWLMAMALNSAAYEIREKNGDIDWAIWEENFKEIFQPEYDLERANSIAAVIVEQLKDEQGNLIGGYGAAVSYANLQDDLSGKK